MWKSGGQPAISLESARERGLSPGTPEDFSAEKGRPASARRLEIRTDGDSNCTWQFAKQFPM